MSLNIKEIRDGKVLTLELEGRMDTMTAPELERVIAEKLDGVETLILDLEKLDYVSSAGLRVLLSAQKKMKAQGKMEVCNVNELVMEVFEITGFTEILTIRE